MKIYTTLTLAALTFAAASSQTHPFSNGAVGFATFSDLGTPGVTGGGAQGRVIRVNDKAGFVASLSGDEPRIVILDADLEGAGLNDMLDEIYLGSNLTLIGSGNGRALNGICLQAKDQHNIIIRNITLTKGREDGMNFDHCHHVWIDHCDLSDSYDGLLDVKGASDYVSVTWTKAHHHNKVSITNSGTCHYEDYGREHITFAHCWFSDNTQRNPRIGYGRMHIYNCYWTNIKSYCIGVHSQAQVLSQNNYFTPSANHPFNNQYTSQLPYCGYLTDLGSYFANGNPGTDYIHPFTGISYTPDIYYSSAFDVLPADSVPFYTRSIGPQPDLLYEPILSPGNGAVGVTTDTPLTWGNIPGARFSLYLGTSPEALSLTSPQSVSLLPATTYYWRVIAHVNGSEYPSAVHRFTTAQAQASHPYPANKSDNPWLRWPSVRDQYCTSMPLSWRAAWGALAYRLSVGTAPDSLRLIAHTSALSHIVDGISLGKHYYWRVDAVMPNNQIILGQLWQFSTPAPTLTVGRNELESCYLSGIAFLADNALASGGKAVRGDQGPGAILATFGGKSGRYSLHTRYFNQKTGPVRIGISVNDVLIDEWLTSSSDDSLTVHNTRNTVSLTPGDQIRIDFIAGYVDDGLNQSYGLLDCLDIRPASTPTVQVSDVAKAPHTPYFSAGGYAEALTLNQVLFCDTLATIGERNSRQVRQRYRSWISMQDNSLALSLQGTQFVTLTYDDQQSITLTPVGDGISLPLVSADGSGLHSFALHKQQPVPVRDYCPVGKSQVIYSPQTLYRDTLGIVGNPGSMQLRPEYAQWIRYDCLTASAVKTATDRHVLDNPATGSRFEAPCVIADPSDPTFRHSPVIDTLSHSKVTYHLTGCKQVTLYLTGSSSSQENTCTLHVYEKHAGSQPLVATSSSQAVSTISSQNIPGKCNKPSLAGSTTLVTSLDPAKSYELELIPTSGAVCIYAISLIP